MDRIQDWKVYQDEAKPVAELMKFVNEGYDKAYEYDRDKFEKEDVYLKDSIFASKHVDLSRVEAIDNHEHQHWGNNFEHICKHVLYHLIGQVKDNRKELQNFFRDREAEKGENLNRLSET